MAINIVNMYRWMDTLMSSKMCTVIFLSNSEGPVKLISLRLNVSPASRRKKTNSSTMVAWLTNPNNPMDPALK